MGRVRNYTTDLVFAVSHTVLIYRPLKVNSILHECVRRHWHGRSQPQAWDSLENVIAFIKALAAVAHNQHNSVM